MYKSRYERLLRHAFACTLNNIATNNLIPLLHSGIQQGVQQIFLTRGHAIPSIDQ